MNMFFLPLHLRSDPVFFHLGRIRIRGKKMLDPHPWNKNYRYAFVYHEFGSVGKGRFAAVGPAQPMLQKEYLEKP